MEFFNRDADSMERAKKIVTRKSIYNAPWRSRQLCFKKTKIAPTTIAKPVIHGYDNGGKVSTPTHGEGPGSRAKAPSD